ncbi:MAG: hypothetical protein RIM33_05235 [Alphaproteobacteria bacterium]
MRILADHRKERAGIELPYPGRTFRPGRSGTRPSVDHPHLAKQLSLVEYGNCDIAFRFFRKDLNQAIFDYAGEIARLILPKYDLAIVEFSKSSFQDLPP